VPFKRAAGMDKKNESTNDLFEIASELDCVAFDLQRIQNLLQLYTEAYEAERDGFLKLYGKQVSWIVERLDTLQAIREAAQILLRQCTLDLEAQAETVYAEHKRRAENAMPTMS
jgi:hypothetical protein